MSKCITLGADKDGRVYGLDLNDDGTWRRNPLNIATSCNVIRPMSKEYFEYLTEDPHSAKESWKACVTHDQTELGLQAWFDTLDKDELINRSSVFRLLDDEDNPTVTKFGKSEANDGTSKFREHLEKTIIESKDTIITESDDMYDWEADGWYPPRKPFVVEFAPKETLEEYYAHLRKTYKGFRG